MDVRRSSRIASTAATATAAARATATATTAKTTTTQDDTRPRPSKRPRLHPKQELEDTYGGEYLSALSSLSPEPKQKSSKPGPKPKPTPKTKPKQPSDEIVDTSTHLPRPPKSSAYKIGAHVSAAGGVENAPVNASLIGASAFALFLKYQRKWVSPPLTPSSISLFKHRLASLGYSPKDVLPHGSYLINLANPDAEKRKKSYDCFVDDLKRCEALGLELYNFHPGSSVGHTPTPSLTLIAQCINDAHLETPESGVVVVLENMAGTGSILGSTLEQLASIIAQVEDKTRVGVCLDTCHAFSAGYDFRTKEGWNTFMRQFDEIVGLKYLRGMHLNDSKTPFGSRKDRHENIGMGTLSLTAFHHVLTDPRTIGIPLVLETPSFESPKEVWGVEIGVLRALAGRREAAAGGVDVKQQGVVDKSEEEGEETLEDLADRVKQAVKNAEREFGAKKSSRSGKGKRKRGEEDEGDEDGDEDGVVTDLGE